jgi:hypothetical protein
LNKLLSKQQQEFLWVAVRIEAVYKPLANCGVLSTGIMYFSDELLTTNETLFNFETYTTCVLNAALNVGVVE